MKNTDDPPPLALFGNASNTGNAVTFTPKYTNPTRPVSAHKHSGFPLTIKEAAS